MISSTRFLLCAFGATHITQEKLYIYSNAITSQRKVNVPNDNNSFLFIRFSRNLDDDDNNRFAANRNVHANIFVVDAVVVDVGRIPLSLSLPPPPGAY